MNPRWLIKAKRWALNPPSKRQVVFTLSVVAACLALGAWEWLFGWPEWLTVNSLRRVP